MLEVNHRKIIGIISSKDIYYADSLQQPDRKCDVVHYRHCSKKMEPCIEFHTLYIDLTQSEEELLNSFGRNTRRYIRQIAKREDLEIKFIEQPTKIDLEKFAAYYNKFAMLKNIYKCPEHFLNEVAALEQLVIIRAVMFEKILAQFAFVIDEERVIVYCGCTARLFCYVDPEIFPLIKLIHLFMDYQAMLFFKSRNIKVFDFCGLVVENGRAVPGGPNQYKLGFGGQQAVEYHFVVPYTLKGHLFCWLKNWRNRIMAGK